MDSLDADHRLLLVTADDRTGALEIGGVLASTSRSVAVGPNADDPIQCVVDIESRHSATSIAYTRMIDVHQRGAKFHCHKMDSGLRGNWPHEVKALVDLGYKVAVVPSYPDAGRRCDKGIVYIDDVPLLDSPFGNDPFSAPCSSSPVKVLESRGCMCKQIVVWDANTNRELKDSVKRCLREDRVLVGPTGAIEVFAREIYPTTEPACIRLHKPILIACGSLNETSRRQLDLLDVPELEWGAPAESYGPVGTISTPMVSNTVSTSAAAEMATAFTAAITRFERVTNTLVIIGGDTVASYLGDGTVNVIGTADTGIPVTQLESRLLVTKGGGIGKPDTLKKLVQMSK